MARRFLTPTSACVLTSSGSIVGSISKYCWLGLTADNDNAASAAFYNSGSATAGQQLWSLATGASGTTPMVGPFECASGVYVAISGTDASAMVAMG